MAGGGEGKFICMGLSSTEEGLDTGASPVCRERVSLHSALRESLCSKSSLTDPNLDSDQKM